MEARPCWQDYARALQDNERTVIVNQSVPLEFYYGIANSLLTEAALCRRQENLPELYTVLMRLANLRAEAIPTHNDYDHPDYSHKRAYFRRVLVKDVLPELERLKPELKRRMEQLKKLDHWRHIEALSRDPLAYAGPSLLERPAEKRPVYLPPSPQSQTDSELSSPYTPVPPSTPRDVFPRPRPGSAQTPKTLAVPRAPFSSLDSSLSFSSLPACEEPSTRRSFRPASDCHKVLPQLHDHETLPDNKAPLLDLREPFFDDSPPSSSSSSSGEGQPQHAEAKQALRERVRPELRLSIPERHPDWPHPPPPPWDPYALLPWVEDSPEFETPSLRKRGLAVLDSSKDDSLTPFGLRVKGEFTGRGLNNNSDLSEASTPNCKPNRITDPFNNLDSRSSSLSLMGSFDPYFSKSSSDNDLSAACFRLLLSGEEGKPGRWIVSPDLDKAKRKSVEGGAPLAGLANGFAPPATISLEMPPAGLNLTATDAGERVSGGRPKDAQDQAPAASAISTEDSTEEVQMVQCSICFEDFPSMHCVSACIDLGTGDTAGRNAQGDVTCDADDSEHVPCFHWHCVDCLGQYASIKVLESRTSRIVCTSTGCSGEFTFDDVEWTLGEKDRDVYVALLAEDMMTGKVYCPYHGCNTVMECPEDARGPDSICAVCKRVFCRVCCVPWHYGMDCDQFDGVKQDGPLHELAVEQKWKSCPRCKHMIERKDGCNFVQCKCGCGFCYQCGVAYRLRNEKARNPHGTPNCDCKLFAFQESM